MTERHFYAYLPGWRPTRSMRDLLKTRYLYWSLNSTAALLANTTYQAIHRYGPISEFMLAYARDGGKYAFNYSERTWQESVAAQVMRVIYHPFEPTHIQKDLNLKMSFLGMHAPTRMLRFNWMQVECSLDVDRLWCALADYGLQHVERFYRKRWKDKRYGFATEQRCPVPIKVAQLHSATDFQLALAFECAVHACVAQWKFAQARYITLGTLNSTNILEEHTHPLAKVFRFSDPIVNMFHDNNSELLEAVRNIHVREQSTFIACRSMPATVISEVDNLIERSLQHETLGTGQQGQIRQGAESSDGS